MKKVDNIKISNISRGSIYKIYRENVLKQASSLTINNKNKTLALKYKTR